MVNINEWKNETKHHKRYLNAIKKATNAVDAAKAKRGEEMEKAAKLVNDERGKAENAAQSRYNAAVAAAKEQMGKDMGDLVNLLGAASLASEAKAPSQDQLNYLEALRIKGGIKRGEAESAFEAMRGSAIGTRTLAALVKESNKGASFGEMTICPLPKLYTAKEAEETAKAYTDKAVANLDRYAAGSFFYVMQSQPDAFDQTWTPLCYYLEFVGA